jgi:membrane fusion protein (multidrug efflux system)
MKLSISIIILLTFGMLFLSGCGAKSEPSENSTAQNDTTKTKQDESKKSSEEELIPVETTTIQKGTISSYILLSSNLETEKMADIYSRVQGLVEKIYVEEGDYVKKNQVLMELEAEEYILAEESARVDYEQKKAACERAEAMFKKELYSQQEFEQVKFPMDAAKIAWEQAKLNLSYTKITSPIAGVVGNRFRKPGDRIQPSDKLFTVINLEEMIAVVHVPEREIQRISKGQNAYIFSDNLGNKRYPGWIKRVSPAVDPQSGTFKVTVGVKNVDNELRPGMFVNTHIITDTHIEAVLIPKTAIVYENEKMNVYVVRDSVARKIQLDSGFENYQYIESLSKISEGEKVIVVGQAGLKDSTKVKIISERENVLSDASL